MNVKKYIGDKKFYKIVLLIAVPIMIQNGITNFVSMLDNIMVGQVGTDAMSGVAIANQFIFIFSLFIFGAISGPGIFGAQFYGNDNHDGVRQTFRFKLILCAIISIIGISVLGIFRNEIISTFLHEGSTTGNIAETLKYGSGYLAIDIIGLLPFAVMQCYSSTLRETGETVVPMKAGIVAVFVNLCFNYLLIFGKAGCPRLGAYGAAIATVISRFVECAIVVTWTHRHKERNKFINGAYKNFRIEGKLAKHIAIKGTPLLLNEGLWSMGVSFLNQIYSHAGLAVVAGMNISNTIYNVFNIVFISLGNAVGIIIGQLLGAGKMKEAKETDTKLIAFSVVSCAALGVLLAAVSPFFPLMYNTTDEVRHYATAFICIVALCMPLEAFMNASYFTLRSGGKTFITFLFDSMSVWVIAVPCAYILMNFTSLSIIPLYLICQLVSIIKCIFGYVLVKKGVWIRNIVI
ncbi:MAG: MATE family efflux transporter [Inconstantimicrobium porci]|uniref:MATE family efflux transporter n=1 Tax=Inconstantimicrobium porci TaxID=2652291 RepID=UPI002A90A454|nr:MATE family efflux transporter [Inconstantimicrobium porci]MDY5912241.1 MATE family efflux transporter [Inconstantimicrobium porci]